MNDIWLKDQEQSWMNSRKDSRRFPKEQGIVRNCDTEVNLVPKHYTPHSNFSSEFL